MTQFRLVCDKSTLQIGQMPISNTNLFHPLSCWAYERSTYWIELQLNCQINLSSFPLPSDFLFFFCWRWVFLNLSYGVLQLSPGTTRIRSWLHFTYSHDPSQKLAGKILRSYRDSKRQQQPFFYPFFHFATGRTVVTEDQTGRMTECRNTVDFFCYLYTWSKSSWV